MSTLIEIERAVSALPAPDQRNLLTWLQSVVNAPQPDSSPANVPRRDPNSWLNRLAQRRDRGATGRTGAPLQQIMDDLRGE